MVWVLASDNVRTVWEAGASIPSRGAAPDRGAQVGSDNPLRKPPEPAARPVWSGFTASG